MIQLYRYKCKVYICIEKIKNIVKIESMRILYYFAAFFLIVSGCSFVPNYKQPDMPISNEFNTTDLNIFDNASEAALTSYKEFFQDPDFLDILELALRNNRDLLK